MAQLKLYIEYAFYSSSYMFSKCARMSKLLKANVQKWELLTSFLCVAFPESEIKTWLVKIELHDWNFLGFFPWSIFSVARPDRTSETGKTTKCGNQIDVYRDSQLPRSWLSQL